LAADSARVKKIQQDRFFSGCSPGQPGFKIAFPLDVMMHDLPSFEKLNIISKGNSAGKDKQRLEKI
jgi:hypothetical protein